MDKADLDAFVDARKGAGRGYSIRCAANEAPKTGPKRGAVCPECARDESPAEWDYPRVPLAQDAGGRGLRQLLPRAPALSEADVKAAGVLVVELLDLARLPAPRCAHRRGLCRRCAGGEPVGGEGYGGHGAEDREGRVRRIEMNVFEMKVHPAAEIFPMLSEEELTELAEDIKANGLLHPLIVKDGVLVDGRNRREACRRAGVEPRVEELNGTDPIAYILATNVNRRHLTKGQRAMAVAKLYPDAEHGAGKRKGSKIKVFSNDASREYVSQRAYGAALAARDRRPRHGRHEAAQRSVR